MPKYLIEFNGKITSLSGHCRDLSISYCAVVDRHRRTGESYKECLAYFQENSVKEHAEYRNLIKDYKVKNRTLYKRWHVTKQKCENPNHSSYKWYGARGIKVCDRWQDYENFETDLLDSFLEHAEQYGIKDTTLERKDYDGDYEPSNCTWATRLEQAKNKHEKVSKYYLPCNKSLRQHCIINNYDYFSVVYYIKRYNLQPYQALARYLKNKQKVIDIS